MFLACAAALPLFAQPGQFDLTADKMDANDITSRAIGHARMSDGRVVVTADEILLDNQSRNVITAHGHVVVTRGAIRLLADQLVYRRNDGSFNAEHVRLGVFPYYVAGESAAGTAAEITVNHATVSYGEPGPWQPAITAEKIVYSPGQRLRTEKSTLGIGESRFLPLPKLTQELHDPLVTDVAVSGGFTSALGAYVEAGLHLQAAPGMQLGADVGLYTKRGLMFGPAGTYTRGPEDSDMSGYFRTGFINDHGNKLTDVLGRPVSANRGFVEGQHAQRLTDNLSLSAQVNWWKDSEILRDFRPRDFFRVQEPDTFVETTYTGQNYFLSAFARFRPNTFESVQERLPELRFDLLPTTIGAGFLERFNASAAVLREIPPLGGPRLQSDRFDAYYALSRPIAPTDWFAFAPVAGARITHYADTTGAAIAGGYTRTLGELGFDAALHTSGTFDYKNALWDINGLRHLFTPRLSYRYIPEAAKGRNQIPQIDRQVQINGTTDLPYLQPLGLGEPRNLDDLHATNTLRLSLDNTLQTRDATYGSRDLLTLNVAADFHFTRGPGERDVSEVHTEAAFAPARWLQVDSYSRLTPQTATMQEFNSGLTLHDGTAWSLRFSNNFLRTQIQDYHIEGRARINERYTALARLSYDARAHRFNQQTYGLVQNLGDTWRVSYDVNFSSGPSREGHFGLNVQIETIGF